MKTKFEYGQLVTFKGEVYTIVAKSWYQSKSHQADVYVVHYLLSRPPGFEHDGNVWTPEGAISC